MNVGVLFKNIENIEKYSNQMPANLCSIQPCSEGPCLQDVKPMKGKGRQSLFSDDIDIFDGPKSRGWLLVDDMTAMLPD